jgi:hypothetical protein
MAPSCCWCGLSPSCLLLVWSVTKLFVVGVVCHLAVCCWCGLSPSCLLLVWSVTQLFVVDVVLHPAVVDISDVSLLGYQCAVNFSFISFLLLMSCIFLCFAELCKAFALPVLSLQRRADLNSNLDFLQFCFKDIEREENFWFCVVAWVDFRRNSSIGSPSCSTRWRST